VIRADPFPLDRTAPVHLTQRRRLEELGYTPEWFVGVCDQCGETEGFYYAAPVQPGSFVCHPCVSELEEYRP
jgi:hypothetical protein